MLSRGLAGVAGRTLVINLPGSTGGVRDGMAVLAPVLVHAVEQLHGADHPATPEGAHLTRGWPATLDRGHGRAAPAGPARRRRVARGAPTQPRWLDPWEATSPFGPPGDIAFGRFLKRLNAGARRGRAHAVRRDVRAVDSSASSPWRTSSGARPARPRSATGWTARSPAAASCRPPSRLATDHCFGTVGLHRIEINIRPENTASLRVVEKLGFRDEGVRVRLLHINGAWSDHRSFALTAEEVPRGRARPLARHPGRRLVGRSPSAQLSQQSQQ